MKIRWAAAAVTALMSLMNLPLALEARQQGIPAPLGWAITMLGVLGMAAAIGLVRHAQWGRTAVLAVGLVNTIGALIALVVGAEGAIIGLSVSALILILGSLTTDPDTASSPTAAPSLN